jgi:hypothetical protein
MARSSGGRRGATKDLAIGDRVVLTGGIRRGREGFVLGFGDDGGASVEVRLDGSDDEPEYHWEWRTELVAEGA